MLILLKNTSEWKGRVIAYLGGGGISTFSYQASVASPLVTGEAAELWITQVAMQVEAQLNANPLIAQPLDAVPAKVIAAAASISSVELTPSNLISIAGLLVVIGRLIFDVWKYFDGRKQTRLERASQSQLSKPSEPKAPLKQGVNLAASKLSSQSKVLSLEMAALTGSPLRWQSQLQVKSLSQASLQAEYSHTHHLINRSVCMINPEQLLLAVVRPILKNMVLWSPAAEQLVIGTIYQESLGCYLMQRRGPALGIIQMEPATYNDIWQHYLHYRPNLAQQVRQLASVDRQTVSGIPKVTELVSNLSFAVAMCRIHYLRVPSALPIAGDIEALGHYWKQYYNTVLGAGTVDEFITHFPRAILGSVDV